MANEKITPSQRSTGDMDPEEFRAAAKDVADRVANYLRDLEKYDVFPRVKPGDIQGCKTVPDALPCGHTLQRCSRGSPVQRSPAFSSGGVMERLHDRWIARREVRQATARHRVSVHPWCRARWTKCMAGIRPTSISG